MVPHAERANTACFLEEVIKYIDTLKKRNAELEKQLLATRNGMHGANPMASLGGNANAAVTAAAAAFAAVAADAHQHMAAQQQQQQQPSTSAGAEGGAGGSRELSGSPTPGAGGIQRLSASALAALQPSAVLAAAMRMGEGVGQPNYAFLEQALLQNALSQQVQQHASRLAQAGLASGSGQQEQPAQQEEKKRAPYGSTLPPELQKLLHEAPADEGANGVGLHGQQDAGMMLAPAGLPHVSGSGGSGQQRRGSADGGSPMSSEESGAPQKKRKVLQG